jgi:uncharacterized membrane protein YvbJ
MTDQAYCPTCGVQRLQEAAFCASCGARFQPAGAPSIQQGLAGGMLELEQMRMKLIVGRLIGIAIGLAIWWFVIGPTFADNPLIIFGALIALAFGGLYAGTLTVLALHRR